MKIKKQIKRIAELSPMSVYLKLNKKRRELKRKFTSTQAIDKYLINNNIKKMQIGCGSNILKGWLNTDINVQNGATFLDAGKKFNIPSNSFDYIYSEHLFEHLNVEQQINMLKEGYRVLNDKGIMRIATPTLDFLFDVYRDPTAIKHQNYVKWAINSSLTLQPVREGVVGKSEHYCYVINNFFHAWGHQMIHNFSSIEKLALQCGFRSVRLSKVGVSEVSVFRGVEMHGNVIPEDKNLLETMVIELLK